MCASKASIIVKRSNKYETIKVLFNPNEYTIDTTNKYHFQKVPGLSAPIAQFISGETDNLTMDLYFDTYEQGTDVRNHTNKIVGLMEVDSDLHTPPVCRFVWGSLDFKGVVEKVNQRYTMFLDSGLPVRAVLKVTFRQAVKVTEQLQQTPRQSADRTKSRQVKQGEQLWMIANEEYEDPGRWREIAQANGIGNPRVLEPGRQLIIPALE
ncbi:MAG: LysM peptidoglycan-binding domain-containing protein [Firmicutes bacterium]|nr:LysM peptidoglycan-binding domain-containing protein [Bacillota bacterium]